jgi:amino acid transporter
MSTKWKKKMSLSIAMKRELGLLDSIGILIGGMMGSGIFLSPIGILRRVRSVGLSLMIWSLLGVVTVLQGLCFVELGLTFPESGGEYVYMKKGLGNAAGFFLLLLKFLICVLSNAIMGLMIGAYILQPLFGNCIPPLDPIRIIAMLNISK